MAQGSLKPGSTYRLETFGKLSLGGGATGSVSHQRRRLALLALLAASGERGLSRDQLIGYLWPESGGDSGRHSLEQLVHSLRRALGEPIFSGTNPLSLNAAAITSDIGDFTHALSNEHLDDAVALYHGPFLQGFYLDDAAEFERWTTIERARLEDRHADALNRLASDAEKAGNHTAAVKWRRRLAEADPVSSRHALGFMRALVAAGDRTSALQHARIYERSATGRPSPVSIAAIRSTAPSARYFNRQTSGVSPQSIFSFDPATAGTSTRNVESGYQLQLSLRYGF